MLAKWSSMGSEVSMLDIGKDYIKATSIKLKKTKSMALNDHSVPVLSFSQSFTFHLISKEPKAT